MKDELVGKVMKEFMELKAKGYSYLTDDKNDSKIAKGIKEDMKEHNTSWQNIPDYSFRILIIGGTVSGKSNA